jgi:hypothetical protein
MHLSLSRRTFVASAAAMLAAPALRTAAAEEPLVLRCSLETAPSHTRNAIVRDYLARIESAARGRIKTQLFESGQLFPDLQVGKALLQGQVEMAAPGCWTLTGIVPDADFLQLPGAGAVSSIRRLRIRRSHPRSSRPTSRPSTASRVSPRRWRWSSRDRRSRATA